MSSQGEAPQPPKKSIEIIPIPEMKELGEYFNPSNEMVSEGEQMFRKYISYIRKAEAGIVHLTAASERIAKNKLHGVSADQLHEYAMSYQSWMNSWHGHEKLKHGDWARGNKDRVVETLRTIDPSLNSVNSTHFEDFIEAYSQSFERRYWTTLCSTHLAWLEDHMQTIESLGLEIAEKKGMVMAMKFYGVFHHSWMMLKTHGNMELGELVEPGRATLLKAKAFLDGIVSEERDSVNKGWMSK